MIRRTFLPGRQGFLQMTTFETGDGTHGLMPTGKEVFSELAGFDETSACMGYREVDLMERILALVAWHSCSRSAPATLSKTKRRNRCTAVQPTQDRGVNVSKNKHGLGPEEPCTGSIDRKFEPQMGRSIVAGCSHGAFEASLTCVTLSMTDVNVWDFWETLNAIRADF